MDPISNDPTFRALSFALDGLSLRQRATANNIANVDTPGYKAQHVNFESQLQAAINTTDNTQTMSLATTSIGHMAYGNPQLTPANITVEAENNAYRNDDNNVDVDVEMTQLAETTLRYQALTQLTGMKISLLKNIVSSR